MDAKVPLSHRPTLAPDPNSKSGSLRPRSLSGQLRGTPRRALARTNHGQDEQIKRERKGTYVCMRRARDIFGARTIFERKHSLSDHLSSIGTYNNNKNTSVPRLSLKKAPNTHR